jgi:uncharacterized membrane protein YhaH (DUF805 family)
MERPRSEEPAVSDTSAPPPADWYPDPDGGSYLRWWNGIAWGDQTKPDGSSDAASTAEQPTLELYPTYPTAPTLPYGVNLLAPPAYPGDPSLQAYPLGSTYGPAGAPPPMQAYPVVQAYGTAVVPHYGAPAPVGAWRSPVDDRPLIRGMGDAIRTVFQKYAAFEGRATRPEFWYWYLFSVLVGVGGALVLWIPVLGVLAGLALFAFGLAVLIPTYAVMVRRLRDGGFHWAFLLLALVPFGGIALLVMLCQPSKHP